jgi:PAP2 superfamily
MTLDLQAEKPPAPGPPKRSPGTSALPQRRFLLAGPAVALVTVVAALAATEVAGVPLRDPDNVAGRRLLLVVWFVLALVAVDVVVRAALRSARWWPSWAALRSVRSERWTPGRGLAVAAALVAFYATYLGYRNLKSVVPLLRPGDLFDRQLGELDRDLFLGHDPAAVLHGLWGVGAATHVLSAVYMLFFLFIPATLAAALVFLPDLRRGFVFVTAMSLNWALGAASYFLLPSLGPIYVDPAAFSDLPGTSAADLQTALIDQRLEFLRDPALGTAQSIGAFASLHVSIFFTAALAAHLLGLGARIRIAAWILFGLTAAATIHLGWHYVIDDFGGIAIGVLALAGACLLTGFDPRTARRRPS